MQPECCSRRADFLLSYPNGRQREFDMRGRVALAMAAVIAVQICGLATRAQAQSGGIPCNAFQKNADGTWTVLATTYIEGPGVKVQEGGIVQPGRAILGYDIAAMIAKACPNATLALPSDETPNLAPGVAPSVAPGTAPSSAPSGAPRPAVPAPQAPSFLARYADANGNIDVRQLTCGHLAEASAEEAQLVFAWYSGWYNGSAKGRGINLARVRYNIRNIVDYCKANRDKKLTDVMERMLK
jgi:hypothetical protein